jgi:hypothetical protein
MSTAYYPLGMRSAMPASGYNHKSTYYNKQYLPWKGTGPIGSNPVGVAAGHIRPLTNKDPGNVFPTGFGLARPIKHYRKGRVIPSQDITANNLVVQSPINKNILLTIDEAGLINYNMNRYVASSKGTSLGGGFGGSGLLNEMQDKPGGFIIKQNPNNGLIITAQDGNTPATVGVRFSKLDNNCQTCEGVGIVSSYYPNKDYLTENPQPVSESRVLCCNPEYKAKRRAIYASTNLKKNYYTTTKQYLQNRCQTYEQKAFNFQQPRPIEITEALLSSGVTTSQLAAAKPGSALALTNTYLANCFPNFDIYDATEDALIAKLLAILVSKNILTAAQVIEYESLINAYNFDTLLNYLNSLPSGPKELALSEFDSFINNPYWGVPFAGPSNSNGCKLTVYKPNNPQYATQGAVSSSTRLLKLNVDTISTNAASIQNYNNTGAQLVTANELYAGNANNYANLLKNKAPTCDNPTIFRFQNKKLCYYKKLPEYQNPASQPSPYRYYPGTVFRTNHFSQSPNTYNTTTGSAAY